MLPRQSDRLPALDGIRGLAILLVLVGHYLWLWPLARAGVYLFFILSGYLITGLLLREIRATGTLRLRRFYLRRILRLAPAYLLWLAVTVTVMVPDMSGRDWGEVLALLTYTANYYQLAAPGLDTGWPFAVMVRHGWSLSVEEQFYLLWPVLLLTLTKRRHVLPVLAFIAVALFVWRWMAPYPYVRRAFETNAAWLSLGCLLATWGLTVPSMRRVLWLEWLGRVSYPAYLWHVWAWYLGTATSSGPAGLVLAVTLTLIAGHLSTTLLEQPILRWRDRRLSVSPPIDDDSRPGNKVLGARGRHCEARDR